MVAFMHCDISEGPRPGYKAVGVPSAEGHFEYLTIEDRFLKPEGNTFLLPVRLIGRDLRQKMFLVKLPVEADSGANRVWVQNDALQFQPDEVPV